jgi:hypothetical protein
MMEQHNSDRATQNAASGESSAPDGNHAGQTTQRKQGTENNKDTNRSVESGMEYWKVQYDFYKHRTTLALAFVAALGALLGSGVFDPSRKREIIYFTFGWLLSTVVAGFSAMANARENIWKMRTVTDEQGFNRLRKPGSWSWILAWAVYIFFTLALIGFVALLAVNVLLKPA